MGVLFSLKVPNGADAFVVWRYALESKQVIFREPRYAGFSKNNLSQLNFLVP
jgi:hypothetical protein